MILFKQSYFRNIENPTLSTLISLDHSKRTSHPFDCTFDIYENFIPIALLLGWLHLHLRLDEPCSESLWRQVR